MKKTYLLMVLLLIQSFAFSQEQRSRRICVTGTVRSNEGNPISGVNVSIRSITRLSGIQGKYSICITLKNSIDKDVLIVFDKLGYETMTDNIQINPNVNRDYILKPSGAVRNNNVNNNGNDYPNDRFRKPKAGSKSQHPSNKRQFFNPSCDKSEPYDQTIYENGEKNDLYNELSRTQTRLNMKLIQHRVFEYNEDPTMLGATGWTCLHECAVRNDTVFARKLILEYRVNVNIKTCKNNSTALLIAMVNHKAAMVRLLRSLCDTLDDTSHTFLYNTTVNDIAANDPYLKRALETKPSYERYTGTTTQKVRMEDGQQKRKKLVRQIEEDNQVTPKKQSRFYEIEVIGNACFDNLVKKILEDDDISIQGIFSDTNCKQSIDDSLLLKAYIIAKKRLFTRATSALMKEIKQREKKDSLEYYKDLNLYNNYVRNKITKEHKVKRLGKSVLLGQKADVIGYLNSGDNPNENLDGFTLFQIACVKGEADIANYLFNDRRTVLDYKVNNKFTAKDFILYYIAQNDKLVEKIDRGEDPQNLNKIDREKYYAIKTLKVMITTPIRGGYMKRGWESKWVKKLKVVM